MLLHCNACMILFFLFFFNFFLSIYISSIYRSFKKRKKQSEKKKYKKKKTTGGNTVYEIATFLRHIILKIAMKTIIICVKQKFYILKKKLLKFFSTDTILNFKLTPSCV